jgi:hypothetical protein
MFASNVTRHGTVIFGPKDAHKREGIVLTSQYHVTPDGIALLVLDNLPNGLHCAGMALAERDRREPDEGDGTGLAAALTMARLSSLCRALAPSCGATDPNLSLNKAKNPKIATSK